MENLKSALLYLFIGLVFVVGGAWISSKLIHDEKSMPLNKITVECPANFLAYNELSKMPEHTVELINKIENMYAENGQFVGSKIVVMKNETKNSKIACGYLYVSAGTSNGSLKPWENIYINPNDFGGHINSENQIGPGDGSKSSEYLFPLNKMSYWRNLSDRGGNILSNADWSALMNVSDKLSFIINLNTENQSGFINKMSIAYKCWDPQTGEENDGCKLNIIDRQSNQKIILP